MVEKRMTYQVVLAAFCLLLFANTSVAQDIHFSQYYNTPLQQNPALTGKVYGKYRIIANYRNQWFGLVNGSNVFSTMAISADVPIRFKNKDVLGVGLYMVNDNSGGGKLKNLAMALSLAYHKALGVSKNHFISLGLQTGFIQKQLDLNLRLGNEISLEDLTSPGVRTDALNGSAGNFDLQAGIHWNSQFTDRVNIYAGVAIAHITQPKQLFSTTSIITVPIRSTTSIGGDFRVSDKLELRPSVLYMRQTNASQTNFGLTMAIDVVSNTTLFLGGYYRLSDAVIPYFGLDIKGFQFGVSYDATTSSLSGTGGSFEISFMYIGKYIPVPDVKPSLYCPRF